MKKYISLIVLCIAAVSATYVAQGMNKPHASSTDFPNLGEGLVGFWSFDHKSLADGTVPDKSGNGYDGMMVNSNFFNSGEKGLKFDGVDDYVDMGDVLDLIGSPISISVWVKAKSCVNLASIVDKRRANPNYQLSLSPGVNPKLCAIQFAIGKNPPNPPVYRSMTSSDFSPSQWTHVMLTFDNSTTGKIYLNGLLDTTVTAFGIVTREDTSTPLTFGNNPSGTTGLNGSIDAVRIYNRVLSDQEALELYTLINTDK